MEDRIPYTYFIRWNELNLNYYGRRTAKNCHPEEFFISYFTSSNLVEEIRAEFGEPDVIKVHKIFSDIESCKYQEERFLKHFNAAKSYGWLNQTNGDKKFDNTGKSRVCSEQTKIKIRNSVTGIKHSEETKYKMSCSGKARSKRKPHTEESKLKISQNRKGILKGVPKTEHTKQLLSIRFKGKKLTQEQKESAKRNRKFLICPYCGISSKYNMKRYHFENCKSKP